MVMMTMMMMTMKVLALVFPDIFMVLEKFYETIFYETINKCPLMTRSTKSDAIC